jgi:hypothetical protein
MKKTAAAMLMLAISLNAIAATAFLKGQYVSGMNRICLYDHLGSTVAITVRSIDLCPLTIDV